MAVSLDWNPWYKWPSFECDPTGASFSGLEVFRRFFSLLLTRFPFGRRSGALSPHSPSWFVFTSLSFISICAFLFFSLKSLSAVTRCDSLLGKGTFCSKHRWSSASSFGLALILHFLDHIFFLTMPLFSAKRNTQSFRIRLNLPASIDRTAFKFRTRLQNSTVSIPVPFAFARDLLIFSSP